MSEWKKVSDGLNVMYAPNGQAQINRWRKRNEAWATPMIEVTTATDELTQAMAEELRDDLNWLFPHMMALEEEVCPNEKARV